jgi:hypothetical protein
MNIHVVTAASAVPPERALGEVERANPQVNIGICSDRRQTTGTEETRNDA